MELSPTSIVPRETFRQKVDVVKKLEFEDVNERLEKYLLLRGEDKKEPKEDALRQFYDFESDHTDDDFDNLPSELVAGKDLIHDGDEVKELPDELTKQEELYNMMTDLDEENSILCQKLDEQHVLLMEMLTENGRMKKVEEENFAIKKQVECEKKEVENCRNEVFELRNKVWDKGMECSTLEKMVDELQMTKVILRNELSATQSMLKKSNDDVLILKQNQSELQIVKNNLENLREEKSALEDKLVTFEEVIHEREKLKNDNQILRKHLAAPSHYVLNEQLTRTFDAMDVENKRLKRDNKVLLKQTEYLNLQMDELKSQLRALHHELNVRSIKSCVK